MTPDQSRRKVLIRIQERVAKEEFAICRLRAYLLWQNQRGPGAFRYQRVQEDAVRPVAPSVSANPELIPQTDNRLAAARSPAVPKQQECGICSAVLGDLQYRDRDRDHDDVLPDLCPAE